MTPLQQGHAGSDEGTQVVMTTLQQRREEVRGQAHGRACVRRRGGARLMGWLGGRLGIWE